MYFHSSNTSVTPSLLAFLTDLVFLLSCFQQAFVDNLFSLGPKGFPIFDTFPGLFKMHATVPQQLAKGTRFTITTIVLVQQIPTMNICG